ncbi:hypothetical protein M378DRAFT_168888 [Amanita muscaria Koide BX008]|uniref:Protein kinase domain-containing protein n=1 Tax=Amanita muscaria (strain Koide BX008) TaxID=946122 RepID=A0A0C2T007_AMAMK|nr:hypothetical protein M378DRAFT_168888 [Amanita muscaria Koide BX008]
MIASRLKVLQATTLVHCYGTSLLHLLRRVIGSLCRVHSLNLFLMQKHSRWIQRWCLHSLLETTEQFGRLGVTHCNITPGNILFSPGNHPVQAVIIDFGECSRR